MNSTSSQEIPCLAESSWLSAFQLVITFSSFQGRPQHKKMLTHHRGDWIGGVTQTHTLLNSKVCIQNQFPNGSWKWTQCFGSDQQKCNVHPHCTVRAEVRVKWEEDWSKLHPLHIQQTTMHLPINHSRTGTKKGKSPETHYGGYTTVGQSMSLNTF